MMVEDPPQASQHYTTTERPAPRRSLVGPAILIGAGVVLFLNTAGWLGWEVWESILRMWPVLLIAAGIYLLAGRRSRGISAVIAVAMVAIVGTAVVRDGTWRSGGTPLIGETISQPIGAATRADVEIAMGAGTLQLDALDNSDQLIAGTITHRARNQLIRDYAVKGDTGTLVLREDDQKAGMFSGRQGENVVWDLQLNREVPLDLTIATGAGRATLDLADVQVTDLRVNTGVGTTTLTVPATGHVQAQVSGGIGTTTIVIPAGMAARIEATAGLSSVNVSGTFEREDKVYTSPGYARADNRIDIRVNSGIGTINLQQTSGD